VTRGIVVIGLDFEER